MAGRRSNARQQAGQVLVLFLLIFTTMVLVASVAVVAGQVLVRRQQAQMVVDAAAFAGASKQAEGLNTIANLNYRSLGFLRKIEFSNVAPRFDSPETSWTRSAGVGFATNDWAKDLLESYQGVFDFYNGAINIANCAYSPLLLPHFAAREVVSENFENWPHSLFREEDLAGVTSHAPLVLDTILVKLTEPEEYSIPPHWYLPNPLSGPGSVSTCASFPVGTALCIETYAAYAVGNIALAIIRAADPIKYEVARFYDNEEGDDVRFAYYLEVSQSPVIFGRNFFYDIPPIVVAAAAKPYGGYLGNTFVTGGVAGSPYSVSVPVASEDDENVADPNKTGSTTVDPQITFWVHGSEGGQEIKATYRAKLVPLTLGEKLALGGLYEGKAVIVDGSAPFEDLGRWNPLTIIH